MENKTALITGGTGYLGSHLSKALKRAGWKTFVYDKVKPKHNYADMCEVADIRDRNSLENVFRKVKFDTVFHLAGRIEVGNSFEEPTEFWDVNTGGTATLLNMMKKYNVEKIVYSSTAGVYLSGGLAIPETECTTNNHVYGNTKLASEYAIEDSGLKYIIFRYFNLAGADEDGEMGEDHEPETHLIPQILTNLNNFKMFGDDYNTPDGTCIRDYVHVADVADAHILAANYLEENVESQIVNLGTGKGHSILEIISLIESCLNLKVNYTVLPRRKGDPDRLVANVKCASELLNFKCKYDIMDIIKTAYNWHNKSWNIKI